VLGRPDAVAERHHPVGAALPVEHRDADRADGEAERVADRGDVGGASVDAAALVPVGAAVARAVVGDQLGALRLRVEHVRS
jgi:hypothetical protein